MLRAVPPYFPRRMAGTLKLSTITGAGRPDLGPQGSNPCLRSVGSFPGDTDPGSNAFRFVKSNLMLPFWTKRVKQTIDLRAPLS